jgi:hypothetical protein
MGKLRNTYETLVRKLEEKRPLGRPRCGLELNIKMILTYIGCESVD